MGIASEKRYYFNGGKSAGNPDGNDVRNISVFSPTIFRNVGSFSSGSLLSTALSTMSVIYFSTSPCYAESKGSSNGVSGKGSSAPRMR